MVQRANDWLYSDLAQVAVTPLSASFHCEHVKTGQKGLICLMNNPAHVNLLNDLVSKLKAAPFFNNADLLEVCKNQNGQSYYVIKRKPGSTLKELIGKKGSMDAQSAYKLFVRITSALARVHKAGFAHNALTPEAIYITNTGVELCQFQYSQSLLEGNRIDKLTIPMEYCAPELFQGSFSRASDIYSLGLILRFIHTGDTPYHFANESSPAYRPVAHSCEKLEFAAKTHSLIRQLVLRCCCKKADNRPSVVQIVKQSYSKVPEPANNTLKSFRQISHEYSFLRYGAIQNIPFCCYQLGQELLYKNRPHEAEYWLNKASGSGYHSAIYLLAKSSEQQLPTEKVVPMMELAYKQGNTNAGYWLACAMIDRKIGNPSRGLELLKAVAEKGDRRAMFKLSLVFRSSKTMQQHAGVYLRESALRGYLPAIDLL